MHGHQGWNVRHGLCHIYMIYVYIWVVYSFCLFCCLFIIVTTQFVALYEPCKPKPKPSTYDPPDNHPLAEIQRLILRPEPKQQICHQHTNTDHFGKQVNTVGTPYNTNVGVQKIPDRAIWKPVVAKRNNTNPWSCSEPQILVTRDSRQVHLAEQPASRDRLE